jgi:hypothetical protein
MKWLHLKALILLPSIGLISLLVNCSFPGDSNGSGVGNGMITGKLYEPDGVTPANGAVVKIWEQNEDIDSNLVLSPSVPVSETKTDKNGMYSIEKVNSGMYVIEASDDNNNLARIDSIAIQNEETRLTLPPDTLRAPGVIKGKIVYEVRNDSVTFEVVCRGGGNNYLMRDVVDTFTFNSLAEGRYHLYIQPIFADLYDCYKSVWVSSGDTTEITIELDWKLPSVNSVNVRYNSLQHSAIISWRTYVCPIPFGYNLYRRLLNETTFGLPINGTESIHDTIWIDSNAIPGNIYQYTVEAIDSSNRAGPLSQIVSTSTIFVTDRPDTFNLVDEVGPNFIMIKSDESEYLYVLNSGSVLNDTILSTTYKLQKYTSAGDLVSSWVLPLSSTNLIQYGSGRLYYQIERDNKSQTIACMDTLGNEQLLSFVPDTCSVSSFDMVGNTIVVLSSKPGFFKDTMINCSLVKYSINSGTVVYSKDISIANNSFDIKLSAEGIVRLISEKMIRQFNTFGQEIVSIELSERPLNQRYEFSDSHYFIGTTNNLFPGRVGEFEFSVYSYSNIQLFRSNTLPIEAVYFFSIASNGDVYLLIMNAINGTRIYRYPNPLGNINKND